MKKKLLSVALSLCMMFMLLPVTAFAAPGDPVVLEYSLDNGQTWTDGTNLADAVFMCYGADNSIIRLKSNIVLDEDHYAIELAWPGKTLTIDGAGYTISRGIHESQFFAVTQANSHVILKNITLDGGAVWDNPDDAVGRTNSGTSLSGTGNLITLGGGASLTLEDGAVLQNNHLKNSSHNGAAVTMTGTGTTLTMKPGAVIRNNAAEESETKGGGGGGVYVETGAEFRMEGGQITGNYASAQGGGVKVGTGGEFLMTSGEISGNASGNNCGGVGNENGSMIQISGNSKITGNKAAIGGAIVPFDFILVAGNPQITGNSTLQGKENNVHLYFADYYLKVASELGENARIGVTSKTLPTAQSPVNVATGGGNYTVTAEDMNRFSYDVTGKPLLHHEGSYIQLVISDAISGLENEKTYCISAEFTVADSVNAVTVDGVPVQPVNGKYTVGEGAHTIVATDAAGSMMIKVTVNASHTPGTTATCTDQAVCKICGQAYGELDADNHTGLVKTNAKDSTHLAEGNIDYWYCDGCEKYFSDAAGTQEITLADTVVDKLAEHTADGTGWHFDGENHWNVCTCGERLNLAAHKYSWVTDKEATEKEKGSKHEECEICGYKKAAVEIPATGTPAQPEKPDVPETGDSSNILLAVALLLISGTGLAGTAVYSRRRKYSK